MSEITRQEFAAAIQGSISAIRHFYREVDLLLQGLRDHLAESPEALRQIPGTSGKSGKGAKRFVVRTEYGALFRPSDPDEELEEEGDGLEEGDEAAEVDTPSPSRRKAREISGGERLLAIRVAIHEPEAGVGFEPHIEYAVMSDWMIGNTPVLAGSSFSVPPAMLKRLAASLPERANSNSGTRLTTRAVSVKKRGASTKGQRLVSCALPQGVHTLPLYDMKNADALSTLTENITKMWRASTPPQA